MKLAFCVVTNQEMFQHSPEDLLYIYTRTIQANLSARHWYGFTAKKEHKNRRRSSFRQIINDIRLLRIMVEQKQEDSLVMWKRDFSEEGFVLVRDRREEFNSKFNATEVGIPGRVRT